MSVTMLYMTTYTRVLMLNLTLDIFYVYVNGSLRMATWISDTTRYCNTFWYPEKGQCGDFLRSFHHFINCIWITYQAHRSPVHKHTLNMKRVKEITVWSVRINVTIKWSVSPVKMEVSWYNTYINMFNINNPTYILMFSAKHILWYVDKCHGGVVSLWQTR